MTNALRKRFEELTLEADQIEKSKRNEYNRLLEMNLMQVDSNKLLSWKVKAKNLLEMACGKESQHFEHFVASETSSYSTSFENLERMMAVFAAAREDFEGGYLSSVRTLVQAEVFGSELEQASELLSKSYKVPAAVIAGTVLETALRELCDRNQPPLPHGMIGKMNDALAKAGVYTLLIQKRITTIAQIRNDAAHGKPDQFNADDVKAMIADVERFLADYLN